VEVVQEGIGMPFVKGTVTRVNQLDDRGDGRAPLVSVSVEGLSALVSAAEPLPAEGAYITAVFECQWRKGQAPLHWLKSWKAVDW